MEQIAVQTLLSIIATMIGILVILIGWIGNRIFTRMDRMQDILRDSETHIHRRLDNHEHRITKAETILSPSRVLPRD